MVGGPLAAAEGPDGGEHVGGGLEMMEPEKAQLFGYALIPSPGLYGHGLRAERGCREGHEEHVGRPSAQVAHGFKGCFYVIDEHHVAILCPKRRQEPQVGAQLASGMGRREAGYVGSQRDVVLGIEDMQGHSCLSQMALEASLGMRQSPRGERLTLPTLGPSGRQERLNCWLKNRRRKVVSHFLIVSSS